MPHVVVVLLTIGLVVMFAPLAAAGAAKPARWEGADYPAAVRQAVITFGAVLTLAAAVTAALASLRS
ncbi:hypothetical protein F9278_25245 [Streptomyces phaeolivaceus]|uniref:Uncharacterized protein n=1 Tax=Streptomyces phaeolivaceus TaxID=2653200 RepID=A0A5P8K7W5_9ACTN|nr:hypothetical protein [Streptomyces phaeolivaceus]QFQ98912.1 hypothetical protein F9278_25245 [Streptomyces phaeolivaceus]